MPKRGCVWGFCDKAKAPVTIPLHRLKKFLRLNKCPVCKRPLQVLNQRPKVV